MSRFEFAKCLAETFSLSVNLRTPVFSKDVQWIAKRPKDTSLNVNKTRQTLRNKPLQILGALDEMKKDFSALTFNLRCQYMGV
jgi:dTDP-4-dehydrorhamnose reductase